MKTCSATIDSFRNVKACSLNFPVFSVVRYVTDEFRVQRSAISGWRKRYCCRLDAT